MVCTVYPPPNYDVVLLSLLLISYCILLAADIPGNFHLVLVNDSLEKAYIRLRDFILSDMETASPTSAGKLHAFSSDCCARVRLTVH